jgi:hypothetical protein
MQQPKQYVVNISEDQKTSLVDLKSHFNLSDKGVMELILNASHSYREMMWEKDASNDVFEVIINKLNLGKKTKKALKLTKEQKQEILIKNKLQELQKRLEEMQMMESESVEESEDFEPLVEICA